MVNGAVCMYCTINYKVKVLLADHQFCYSSTYRFSPMAMDGDAPYLWLSNKPKNSLIRQELDEIWPNYSRVYQKALSIK
jgi:hypothetical protein